MATRTRRRESIDASRAPARSMNLARILTRTPMIPAVMTSEYISGSASADWASATWWPIPGLPMTSSAVTASTSATDAPRRNPVIAYGNAVGHAT